MMTHESTLHSSARAWPNVEEESTPWYCFGEQVLGVSQLTEARKGRSRVTDACAPTPDSPPRRRRRPFPGLWVPLPQVPRPA